MLSGLALSRSPFPDSAAFYLRGYLINVYTGKMSSCIISYLYLSNLVVNMNIYDVRHVYSLFAQYSTTFVYGT